MECNLNYNQFVYRNRLVLSQGAELVEVLGEQERSHVKDTVLGWGYDPTYDGETQIRK